MKYLIIALLFLSCVTEKKAYRKVQEDAFVDAKEKKILLDKTLVLFPDLRDTPKITSRYVDSAEYNATIRSYLAIIDQIVNDSSDLFYAPERTDSVQVRYRVSTKDSLRIIAHFLRTAKIPAIKEQITKEVPTSDGRREEAVRASLIACEASNAKLNNVNEVLIRKLQKKNAKTGWIIGGGLLLSLIMLFMGMIIKKR